MVRLVCVAAMVAVGLGCGDPWTLHHQDEALLSRDEAAQWDFEIVVGGNTVEQVVRGGGQLTVWGTVDGRYRYLLGPDAVLSMTTSDLVPLEGEAAVEVDQSRREAFSFRSGDLLARCAATDCGPEDTGGGCVAERCALPFRLSVDRRGEPGKVAVWLDVHAELTEVSGADRPDLWWSVVGR